MCRFSKLLLFSFFFCKEGSDRLMKRASYSCCNFLCVVLAAAYLKYRLCRLSCLPFVWHLFFHCDTHTRAHAHTHTHTHTHTRARETFVKQQIKRSFSLPTNMWTDSWIRRKKKKHSAAPVKKRKVWFDAMIPTGTNFRFVKQFVRESIDVYCYENGQ